MPESPKILRATTTFQVGGRRRINAGQLFSSDDPIVSGREALFEPVEDGVTVEQATAAPGEKRSTRRRNVKPAE